MRGHSRSKASIKALVRQLPRRTHIEINAGASRKLDPPQGSGSVCCSGALRAPELLENSRPAVRDRRYKNQTDPLPAGG
jgi:hypothetical protein